MLTLSPTCRERIVASSMGVVSFTRAMRRRCYRVWDAFRMAGEALRIAGPPDRRSDAHSRKRAVGWKRRRWSEILPCRREAWTREQHAQQIRLLRRLRRKRERGGEHERQKCLHALLERQ